RGHSSSVEMGIEISFLAKGLLHLVTNVGGRELPLSIDVESAGPPAVRTTFVAPKSAHALARGAHLPHRKYVREPAGAHGRVRGVDGRDIVRLAHREAMAAELLKPLAFLDVLGAVAIRGCRRGERHRENEGPQDQHPQNALERPIMARRSGF